MKKSLGLFIALVLLFAFVGCGDTPEPVVSSDMGGVSTPVAIPSEPESESEPISIPEIESEPESVSIAEPESVPEPVSIPEPESDVITVDWKTFLAEYEAWVDDYMALVEKYNADPTDITLITDYTEMLQEMTEWADKADQITIDIASDATALAEYTVVMARIVEKLSSAALAIG